jgi:hypothetical protein
MFSRFMQRGVTMEDTQDLHHQQQLEQQEQEEPITIQHLDLIAYKCLGVAQAIRDLSFMRDPESFEKSKTRLIELANEFETTRRKYNEQSTKH